MTRIEHSRKPIQVLETKNQLLSWVEESRQNGLITLFDDASPIENHPLKANRNVVQAADHFLNNGIDSTEPLLIVACMGSGKSTLKAILFQRLVDMGVDVDLFTHSFAHNNELSDYWIQAGTEGMFTGIQAKKFMQIEDLNSQIETSEARIILVDEIIFSGSEEDPPQSSKDSITKLIDTAQSLNKKLVLSGLLSDYRGIIWPNIKNLLPYIKNTYEIVGRCDTKGCKNPAVLTSRKTRITKNVTRPSHLNEKILRPGSVIPGTKEVNKDIYNRSCKECHQVFSPQEAIEFDSKHGVDTNDYY